MEPEAWVNAFLGRIFWDFLGEKYWANVVSKKIQMKLSKIRVGTGTSLHTYTSIVQLTNQENVSQCSNVISSRDNFVSLMVVFHVIFLSQL